MSEIWNGPGDDYYPGSDDDEEFELDRAEAAGIDRDAAREALHENDGNDNLIREGIYAAGDSGDPDDHPPTYEEDPSFYDDGITADETSEDGETP